MDSATIVSAALDSKQLEDSINKLVATVASKTKEMADNFTSEVARMEQAVKNLGNIKIDSGSAADGGSSRRTTVLKKEEEQGKAVAMSYDAIAASNKRASDSAVAFLDNERQAYRARQREIEYEIKKLQTRYNSIKINPIVTDNGAFKIAIDNIKQKIQEARQKLQEVPPTSMLGKQFSQELQNLRAEMNNLIQSRKAFEAQGKISNLQAEYAKISESLISLGLAYRRVSTEEKLLESAINNGTNVVSRYGDSADKAYQKMLKLSFDRAMNISTGDIDLAMAKLERLRAILADERFLGVLSPSQIKRARSEVASLENQLNSTIQKSTQKNIKTSEEEIAATKRRVEAERQAAIQNGVFYQNLRQEMRRSGLQAQETSRTIMRNMFEQINSGSKEPIRGLKELEDAIARMRRAFFDMDSTQKQSPLGVALENDIKKAQDAITLIQKYNRELSGVQFIGKDTIGSTKRSYDELKNTLSQLTKEYYQLNKADRDAAKGTELRDKIHAFNREIRDVQRTMARPTSLKKALGLDESTLDHINDKLQALRAYKGGLKITDPKQLDEMKQVDAEIVRLQKNYDKLMAKNQQMIGSNNALGRSWNYMKNRLAFYFSVGASTQFIKNLIEVRSQYEMNERALGILINSAERGTQIFNELSQMALVSPYTLIELSSAAKQLTAYDVAARDVVDTTRRLADMAAAVGIPIERLTYALGQIKAYGYLNSRDARMFANAGIPLVKQLSDYYTELEGRLVSTADVYDRIKKKSIDYNEVMEVMYKMTDQGGKFFDFQAKMADTLKVRLANLTLAWNNMLNDMGKDTQGVLTWGIGALRDLFNQWRVLDRAIKDVAWIVGIRTGIALASYSIQKFIALLRGTQSQMALSEVFGKRLADVIRTLGKAMLSLAKNPLTWVGVVAIGLYQMEQAIWGANEAQIALNKSIRDGAKDNYDNITKFLDQYKQVRESLYTTQKVAIGNMYDPSTGKASATAYVEQSVEQDINKNEAKKAWEAIREQIELTTRSSDIYIGKLLEISNMSERVRQGFNILEDVRTVNAALQELDEDTIKVEKDMSAWWNAYQLPDGLIGNIKDYQKELDDVIKKYGSLESLLNNVHVGGDNWGDFSDYQTALERLQSSIKTTTDSIINFIELKGWSGDINKINEVFKQIADKIALDNQLDPQKAFVLQTQVEEARSQAAKQALLQRINDEKAALAQASDENQRKALTDSINANVAEYNNWDDFNGRKKVEWERFTKWLKEQHISETTAMFRNMDAEDIKSLNFQEGKHAEWVTRMVTQYAKEHKMSYDEAFNYLKSWVRNANQWSIFIPMTISTGDKKTVYAQLGELDKVIDSADSEIERLTTRIDELRKKKELDKEETDELIRAEQELADAQKAKNDAEAKGGHGKKEKKDERASQKAAKQAESELAKALKDELSTIEKVRSIYKDLTKEGMSHADAVAKATKGWNETVKAINKVLQKNGLKKLNLSEFVGTDNPREMLKTLRAQLEEMVKRGASTSEIKVIQEKIKTLEVDADKYDLTKITKGLNNELDRLKDEYELAVSLDADPELGNMFADWMGIDVSDLPRTASEYAERASKILNSKLKDLGAKTELPNVLDITDDDMRAFEENKIFTDKQLELVKKAVEAARGFQKKETDDRIKDWDKLLEKYAEYETKVNKIQNDAVKERVTFAQQFGNEDEKATALNLQTQILAATDQQEKQKLIQQLQKLILSIAGDDKAKINLAVSIDNKNSKDLAKASFEEFQKSPEWITATGELSGMTNNAIKGLIASLEKYKKTAKNLDPKQIKNINNALKNLYKEQRKNNPFGAIADMIDKANERMTDVLPTMSSIASQIDEIEEKVKKGDATEEEIKTLADLKEHLVKLADIGKISASEWVESLMSVYGAVKGAIGLFDDLAKAIGGTNASDVEKVFSILDKTGQGAQVGASFGGYGAIIGAVVGAASGIIETYADVWSGNAAITESIRRSTLEVNRLEQAYNTLEYRIKKTAGTAEFNLRQLAIVNKELQLAELERQLELERSRPSKNKDEERISELKGQINDLKIQIKEASDEITNDLLGISSIGEAAESMMGAFIEALRSGEDAMLGFNDSVDEMIANMLKKLLTTKLLMPRLEKVWHDIQADIDERTKDASASLYDVSDRLENHMWYNTIMDELGMKASEADWDKIYKELAENWQKEYERATGSSARAINGTGIEWWTDDFLAWVDEQGRKKLEQRKKDLQYQIDASWDEDDIKRYAEDIRQLSPEMQASMDYVQSLIEELGLIKEDASSESKLSALQQGIQGITEDTAGALEAYMNGVSQQVYYQSEVLTQIRDAVVMMDGDVQLGTQAQMLLQLQQSYAVQMAIQTILEGWSSPNGLAVRVEMQ